MLVVFCNNQTLVAAADSSSIIFTDPVALGSNNRATGVTNIHTIFGAAAAGLNWIMEMSNDGTTWVPQGPTSGALTAADASRQGPSEVTGVYARLRIVFSAGSGGIGGVTFDIHVNFDRV